MNPKNHIVVTLDASYELDEEQYRQYVLFRTTHPHMDVSKLMKLVSGHIPTTPNPGRITGKSAHGMVIDEVMRDRAVPSTYDPRAAEALVKQTAAHAAAKKTALGTQVGGLHYKNLPIQPVEFAHKNKLTFLEGCVAKRICRHSRGGAGRKDIEKAIHELQLILQLEYGDESTD